MKIKPIKTEKGNKKGLKEIKRLWDAEPGTSQWLSRKNMYRIYRIWTKIPEAGFSG